MQWDDAMTDCPTQSTNLFILFWVIAINSRVCNDSLCISCAFALHWLIDRWEFSRSTRYPSPLGEQRRQDMRGLPHTSHMAGMTYREILLTCCFIFTTHPKPLHKLLVQSVHNVLSNFVNEQTDKPTYHKLNAKW